MHNSYSIYLINPEENHYALSLSIDGDDVSWLFLEPPAKAELAIQLQDARSLKRKKPWDRGVVTFADEPSESFRRGLLKFELAGGKTTGGFMLVRTTSIGRGLNRQKAWRLRHLDAERETAIEQTNGAMAGKTAPSMLWPKAGVTREMLRDYYATIAPLVRSYFKDRPFTLLKGPAGVTGGLFFEQDPETRLQTKSEFEACAAIPALEIHAMNFRADEPQLPDWLVLDLDPPAELGAHTENAFAELRAVARVTHELLTEMGLRFMWKLSGHNGLHVMIPIKRLYETVVVFDFAKMIAEMIYERAPTIATIKLPAHLHSQRVLIDYHRNHYHQSVIAPFSPRALAHPTISLPLAWSELEHATNLPVYELGVSSQKLKESAEILNETLSQPNDLEPVFVFIEKLAQQA